MFGWRRKEPARAVAIDPNAPQEGPGSTFTTPTELGPYGPPGDPYAPIIGRDYRTHGDIARDARIGDPRPNPRLAPERFWRDKVGKDTIQRHSVETIDGDGWVNKSGPAPVNVRGPLPPDMGRNIPHALYSFTRPFDQHSAREMTGDHFSMADHRRNYEIGGMKPAPSRRNTYRLEPTPWDSDIIDMPADIEPDTPQAVITAPGYPNGDFYGGGNNHFRNRSG